MAHLARDFAELPTPAARRAALDAIVDRLTTPEWRELLARLRQRDFRCDVVGASPVELVAHIFRFLPPHAPFLYQRVSRQWQRQLSSSHVTGCAIDSWYSDDDRRLAGEAAGLYSNRLTVQKWKADHVKRFREGRPYHGTFYYGTWNVKLTAPDRGEFPEADFAQDTLAWKVLRRIEAFNFRTGEHHSIMTDAREQIGAMKLTESLVAFFTLFSRVCHIYDLQTKERTHFTLHNQNLDVFAAQGRTVLVASESRNPSWSTRLNIHLWNAVERRTRSFEINRVRLVDEGRPYQYMPKCVVIDERTRSVVWFFCLRKETKNWLSFERWSFEGVLLGRYEHRESVSVYSLRTADIRPMDYEGRLYHIKTPVRPFGYREEPVFARTMTTIVFDNELNQISIKTSNDALGAFRNEYFRKMPFDKFTICLWKDVMLYMPPAVTDEEARTKDSTWGPQTYQTLERRGIHHGIMDIPDDMALEHSGMPGDETLLGNEHLLVLIRRGYCAVWCFDPHLQLPERVPVDDPL
ncbi:f-box domain protein [Diplodia corticola]|uniref:F-box domain protein n=1 Tax=Diplodia corticola TaxID=236234 RepID=A0A1J9SHW1_9PEZI|nr:f-box domain protein [Diplodia corticola]OJD39959.1 f-box domain protein [Diplodia corticola]